MKFNKTLVAIFVLVFSFAGYAEAKGSFGSGSRSGGKSFSRSVSKPSPSYSAPKPASTSGWFTKKTAVVGGTAVATVATTNAIASPTPVAPTKLNSDLATLQKKQAAIATYQKPKVVDIPSRPTIYTSSYKPSSYSGGTSYNNSYPRTYYNPNQYQYTPTNYNPVNYNTGFNMNSALLGYIVGSSMSHNNNTTYVSTPQYIAAPVSAPIEYATTPVAKVEKNSGWGILGFLFCASLLVGVGYLMYKFFTNTPSRSNSYSLA